MLAQALVYKPRPDANSPAAVAYQTGKLKWYFQTVHHELWDYDLPPHPVLIDIVKDGKKRPRNRFR
jgi:glucose dehydrogenase